MGECTQEIISTQILDRNPKHPLQLLRQEMAFPSLVKRTTAVTQLQKTGTPKPKPNPKEIGRENESTSAEQRNELTQ